MQSLNQGENTTMTDLLASITMLANMRKDLCQDASNVGYFKLEHARRYLDKQLAAYLTEDSDEAND